MNGVNYKNLSNTEIAYFLTKNPIENNMMLIPSNVEDFNHRPK